MPTNARGATINAKRLSAWKMIGLSVKSKVNGAWI